MPQGAIVRANATRSKLTWACHTHTDSKTYSKNTLELAIWKWGNWSTKNIRHEYRSSVPATRASSCRLWQAAKPEAATKRGGRRRGQSLPPPLPSVSYQIECSAIFPLNMLYFNLCCFFLAVLLFVLFCFLSLCLQLPFWPLSSHGKELQLQLGLRPRTGN